MELEDDIVLTNLIVHPISYPYMYQTLMRRRPP